MKILVSFPGRYGDLLWALPTVRAISEHFQQPVDLLIAGEFQSIVPLLQEQSYLGQILAADSWAIGAGWEPPRVSPPESSDRVYHLGYRRWPAMPLPRETHNALVQQWKDADGPVPPFDLTRPWITAPGYAKHLASFIAIGFSETHFELKYGIYFLLWKRFVEGGKARMVNLSGANKRWQEEAGQLKFDWLACAAWIARAPVFVGCCSALHVLAVALGTPVILVEPMEARQNPIFYPLGTTGPQVTLLVGGDGKPTVDARHLGDAIDQVLVRRVEPVHAG